jgi:toxin ParE1/3/4
MKHHKVFWTGEAQIDLTEIVEFIAEDNPPAAKSVYKKIKQKCKQLSTSPERCRRVPELLATGMQNYREIISHPYRVIFKLSDDEVYIISVVDGRRDFEVFFFNRILRK